LQRRLTVVGIFISVDMHQKLFFNAALRRERRILAEFGPDEKGNTLHRCKNQQLLRCLGTIYSPPDKANFTTVGCLDIALESNSLLPVGAARLAA